MLAQHTIAAGATKRIEGPCHGFRVVQAGPGATLTINDTVALPVSALGGFRPRAGNALRVLEVTADATSAVVLQVLTEEGDSFVPSAQPNEGSPLGQGGGLLVEHGAPELIQEIAFAYPGAVMEETLIAVVSGLVYRAVWMEVVCTEKTGAAVALVAQIRGLDASLTYRMGNAIVANPSLATTQNTGARVGLGVGLSLDPAGATATGYSHHFRADPVPAYAGCYLTPSGAPDSCTLKGGLYGVRW